MSPQAFASKLRATKRNENEAQRASVVRLTAMRSPNAADVTVAGEGESIVAGFIYRAAEECAAVPEHREEEETLEGASSSGGAARPDEDEESEEGGNAAAACAPPPPSRKRRDGHGGGGGGVAARTPVSQRHNPYLYAPAEKLSWQEAVDTAYMQKMRWQWARQTAEVDTTAVRALPLVAAPSA